jgi:threonine dehydrogenase-like Zn-dependent dehydrogenase
MYGKNDLRLEEFNLPDLMEDEILVDVISNGICMSCYKVAIQGKDHKRVPENIADAPVILGHEFCGTVLEVGKRWQDTFTQGMTYCIQPMLCYPNRELEAVGYSYQYTGGLATKIIIPSEVLEMNCLLPYEGDGFFEASLAEPMSCIIGAFNTQYHFRQGSYEHQMGIADNGAVLILGGCGPMGLGAIDYAIHGPRKPGLLIITDISKERLQKAQSLFSPDDAQKNGVELHYVNTSDGDSDERLQSFVDDKGYDDIFVFAPVSELIKQASRLLGHNGCLNIFAGPIEREFSAAINCYNVHYCGHHVVGSSGGNVDDLQNALTLIEGGVIEPAVMVTHIGGIDAAAETIKTLPDIPGGKKLIYTNISMPLVALDDFEELGESDKLYKDLATITSRHHGIWSVEAEMYLLKHAQSITL